jgi:hypothetical protein
VATALAAGPWLRPVTLNPHDDPHWQAVFTPVAALVGIVFATVVTYGFERPILNLGRGRPRPLGSRESVERVVQR